MFLADAAADSFSDSNTWLVLSLIYYVALIVALWKVFTKAGRPGWWSLIPIVNLFVVIKIAGRPGWWIVLYLIPIVGFIADLFVSIDLAKSYGRSVAFGVIGLWLFEPIGHFILGYGSAEYTGPAGPAGTPGYAPAAA